MKTSSCDDTMKILVADDDSAHRSMVSLLLAGTGYQVLTAENGERAWEIFQEEVPRIVVTDWLMPRMNGLELCDRIRKFSTSSYTYLILLSGQDKPQDIVRGLTGGIDDYVIKPLKLEEFQARIEIGARVVNLETELECRYETIRKNVFQTIRMFSNLIEAYDHELGGHSRRVADLSVKMAARHPEISDDDLEMIETAALLKEVGMIALPPEVMAKSRVERVGEEGRIYRSHPELGELILKEIEFLKPVAALVRSHHEQFNGLGFPDGLKGEEIPIPARIISTATIYDNLRFRGNFTDEKLTQKLFMMRGYQLDPGVVSLMLELHKEAALEKLNHSCNAVPVDELAEGMRLARDFHGATGALLLPGGARLNRISIEKLKNHYRLTGMTDGVHVLASHP